MGFYKHLHIDIDKEQPEYNEYSFSFKMFPNLSVDGNKEFKDIEHVTIRLEWLIWSVVYHIKNKNNERR